jgi:hypothetical protein
MEEPPDRFLCPTLDEGAEGFLPALRFHSKVECIRRYREKNAAPRKPYPKASHDASIFIGILQFYYYPPHKKYTYLLIRARQKAEFRREGNEISLVLRGKIR